MSLLQLVPGRESLIRYARGVIEISREAIYTFNTYFLEEPRVDHIIYSARRRETIDNASAVILGDNNRLLGYVWAWDVGRRGLPILVYLRTRYILPQNDKQRILENLLAWTRRTLSRKTHIVNIITGPLDIYTKHLLQIVIKSPINWTPETHLVVLEDTKKHTTHKVGLGREIQLEEVNPKDNDTVLREIVEIFNDSFLDYPDYAEWRIDDAKNYYEKLYSWSKPIIVVARRDKKAIGYVEAYIHDSPTGKSGLITIIAVKKKYRGHGYGKLLLGKIEEELLSRGAETIYLYAEDPVLNFYRLHGYRVVYTSYSVVVSIDELPIDIYCSIAE